MIVIIYSLYSSGSFIYYNGNEQTLCSFKCSLGPTPDSISNWGVTKAPALKITSFFDLTVSFTPFLTYSIPTALGKLFLVVSNRTRFTWACVTMSKFFLLYEQSDFKLRIKIVHCFRQRFSIDEPQIYFKQFPWKTVVDVLIRKRVKDFWYWRKQIDFFMLISGRYCPQTPFSEISNQITLTYIRKRSISS